MNTYELLVNPLENPSISVDALEGLPWEYAGITLLCVLEPERPL